MSFDIHKFRRVHLIGCAGVGTLPLAYILLKNGFQVSGSDLLETDALEDLRAAGAVIRSGPHRAENIPSDGDRSDLLVIHSSAIAPETPEFLAAKNAGAAVIRRGEALAAMTGLYKRVVSVSGSHGKTSVSAMLAWLFREAGLTPGYLVGGFIPAYGKKNGSAGQGGDLFITEVDESDGTHTAMFSHLGIVTNVEDDHAWSVGGADQLFANFKKYAFQAQHLIYVGSAKTDELFAEHPSAVRLDPDVTASPDLALFDPAALKNWGSFQKLNALTALAAAVQLGLNKQLAAQILSRFPGVDRRMTKHFENKSFVLMEDYAHHPTELRASLRAFREIFPQRRLVIFFQPHRYARLERYFDEFAAELRAADRIYITPVFAAWVASGRYDSADLAAAVGGDKAVAVSGDWQEIAAMVKNDFHAGDLVAVIGAGDLKDLIAPLTGVLKEITD